MDTTLLFPLPEGMLIEEMQATETGLHLTVRATHPTSSCPLCSHPSSSIHSHYQRRLTDATCAGRQIQLSFTYRGSHLSIHWLLSLYDEKALEYQVAETFSSGGSQYRVYCQWAERTNDEE